MKSSSGLAASGTLESTGDVPFEAVIPAGLLRRVRHVRLAETPHEENGPAAVTAGVTPCPPGVLLAGAVTGRVSAGR